MSLNYELPLLEKANYQAFWDWFKEHSQDFYETLQKGELVEEDLISLLAPKVNELDLGLYFLIGLEENSAKLVFTPDGNVRKVYLAEELVATAPEVPYWRFSALKPPTNVSSFSIRMLDLEFDKDKISFYPRINPSYPDEIDLVMIYRPFQEEFADEITNGVFIFLDNFLGEETMIDRIDRLEVRGPGDDIPEEIPVEKLPDYIDWREKEFVEKYQDITFDLSEEQYAGYEAALEDGTPIISTINTGAMKWDHKASHPWMFFITLHFEEVNEVGFPTEKEYNLLSDLDNQAYQLLPILEGNIYLGRELGDSQCDIYYACKDYRMASKIADWIVAEYKDKLNITIDIFKDKYWQALERFNF